MNTVDRSTSLTRNCWLQREQEEKVGDFWLIVRNTPNKIFFNMIADFVQILETNNNDIYYSLIFFNILVQPFW